jgi:hypothetical protein
MTTLRQVSIAGFRRACAILCLCVALATVMMSCAKHQTVLRAEHGDVARQDPLTAWLTCIECTEGQLDSLVARASTTTASNGAMRDTLERAVVVGPTNTELAATRTASEQDYVSIQLSLSELGDSAMAQSREEYADSEVGAFIRLYRIRAAVALVRIDRARARAIIASAARAARDLSVRDALIRTLRDTLRAPNGP